MKISWLCPSWDIMPNRRISVLLQRHHFLSLERKDANLEVEANKKRAFHAVLVRKAMERKICKKLQRFSSALVHFISHRAREARTPRASTCDDARRKRLSSTEQDLGQSDSNCTPRVKCSCSHFDLMQFRCISANSHEWYEYFPNKTDRTWLKIPTCFYAGMSMKILF